MMRDGIENQSAANNTVGAGETKKIMGRTTLAQMARKHWTEWLPTKTAELKAAGEFGEAIQTAAVQAQRGIQELKQQGYREHEAAEVALPEYILLTPPCCINSRDMVQACI